MSRTLVILLLAFGLTFSASAQDPGRPPAPRPVPAPALGCVTVNNNSGTDVIYILTSSKGTVRGLLRPNGTERVTFYNDGKPRVLTAFKASSGDLLTTRTITCIDGHIYDVIPMSVPPMPMPLPQPLPAPPPLPEQPVPATLPLPRNGPGFEPIP